MELSDLSDDGKDNHELRIVKLEHELDRARLSFQVNESIWKEKEESLNSIISEQKQVISLLESLLKNNQQFYDQLQESVTQKDTTLQAVNEDIENTLTQTKNQIGVLTRTIAKTEALLSEKEVELQRQNSQIYEQQRHIISLQSAIEKAEQEHGETLTRLKNQGTALIEAQRQNDSLRNAQEELSGRLDISQIDLDKIKQQAELYRNQLDETKRLHKGYAEQRDAYKRARDHLQAELNSAQERTDRMQQQLARTQEKYRDTEKQLVESFSERDQIKQARNHLQEELNELNERFHSHLKKCEETDILLEESRRRQAEYKVALHRLDSQFVKIKNELEQQIKSESARRLDSNQKLKQLHNALEQAKSTYERDVAHWRALYERENCKSEEFEQKLLVALKEKNATEAELSELKAIHHRTQVNLSGLAAREERYRKNIESLEHRLVIERDSGYKTISYQLGYALIQSTKSFANFLRLPGSLLQIRKEGRRRKQEKKQQQSIVVENKISKLEIKRYPTGLATREIASKNTRPAQLAKLRVAAIMDEFTYHSYAPVADVLQLHPETWRTQISDFKPDMVFIESAWNGLEGLWKGKISNADSSLIELIDWSRQSQIPSMFWNKEDPVHFSTFLPIASRVDAIFTTDIDCLPKYKQAVGHNRVYLLPFAAQPLIHNPIEKYDRKDAFNFAGSYYLRYPERQRDFAALVDTVVKVRPLEIYDRNFDNPHPHYLFPDKYQQYIIGTLPFNEIDKAYKGYRYGINMNTIKQSQTMFARRVFELLASNTVVVSNFSRGVRLLFGDLVVSSDNTRELEHRLQQICNDETNYRKLRLAGLRRVMSEHTYHARLQYISRKLLQVHSIDDNPRVYIIGNVRTQSEFDQFIQNTQRQAYEHIKCIVVSNEKFDTRISQVAIVATSELLASQMEEEDGPHSGYVAFFSNNDYYGKNYICDLVLARHFSDAVVFGKASYYDNDDNILELKADGSQYREIESLDARCSIIKQTDLTPETVVRVASEIDSYLFKASNMLALDEFNYCRHVSSGENRRVAAVVNDLNLANHGLSLENDLSELAIEIKHINTEKADISLPQISASAIAQRIPASNNSLIEWGMKRGTFHIASRLPADKYIYMYSRQIYTRAEINMVLNSQFKLECESTCQLKTVFEFQDKDGKKIAHAMNIAGDFNALAIPEHCEKIRFGLRVQGAGDARISRLILGTHGQRPAAIVSASPYLVLTKQYPEYNDLYKYGFLHTRVRAYREQGLSVSVFKISNEKGNTYREFEDVDVVSGDADLLDATLSTGQYKNVLVHLLDEKMWSILVKHLDRVRVTVWVHGAEIQVWQRRQFEFERMSKDEINRQKRLSDKRLKFWRSILQDPHPNLELVFVSQYFADEVSADFGVDLTKVNYDIVHNYIDANVFPYREKHPDKRKRLLSIRPYASRKYANDLTVKAILELSRRDFFSDLEIALYGDGELFDEITAPLKGFKNVKIERRFLSHHEISLLHQEYGVFLTPTRMDSQGVSRDEAMSSGLVPVTTNVTAIPEFVDSECGMLVEGEDYIAMADAIEQLYRSPELFQKLSKSASERVARQSGLEQTILKEMRIIRKET